MINFVLRDLSFLDDVIKVSFPMQFEMENKRLFTEMNSLVDEVRYSF